MTHPEATPSAGSGRSDTGFAVEPGGIAQPAASASPEPSAEALPSTTVEATATDASESTSAVYEAELGSAEPEAEEPLAEAASPNRNRRHIASSTAPPDRIEEDIEANPVVEKESSPSVDRTAERSGAGGFAQVPGRVP